MATSMPAPLRREDGSLLIEVLVTATILVIVAIGLLSALDRADARGAEQRARVIAGTVAQAEQDRLRGLPISQLSNLRTTSTVAQLGQTYSIESRAEWITDASGDAACTTAGAPADYLKITSTITSTALRGRKPITLSSIIAPPTRAFNSTQGSLSIAIVDRLGAPVPGVALSLAGPPNVSATTNALGCVLWGYLPAGPSYQLSFSRTGSVDPYGQQSVTATTPVVGEQTSNHVFSYDRGAAIELSFATTRLGDGVEVPSAPLGATVENAAPPGVQRQLAFAGATTTTPLLFPFTTPYAVFADRCASARPPAPVTVALGPGETRPARVLLPALDVRVHRDGVAVAGATVRVRTPCGTTLTRTTNGSGRLADPGFPFAAVLTLCVSDGTRRDFRFASNTSLPGSSLSIDLDDAGGSGACPA